MRDENAHREAPNGLKKPSAKAPLLWPRGPCVALANLPTIVPCLIMLAKHESELAHRPRR